MLKLISTPMKWYMKWIIHWTVDIKSSEALILAVMTAILAIADKGLKNSGFQRGLNPWPRDTGAAL